MVTACCFIHHLGYHFLLLSEDSAPWSSSRRGSCLPSASNRGRQWSFTSRRECMMFYYLLPALYPTFTSLLTTSGGSGLFSGGCSASSSASCSSSSGSSSSSSSFGDSLAFLAGLSAVSSQAAGRFMFCLPVPLPLPLPPRPRPLPPGLPGGESGDRGSSDSSSPSLAAFFCRRAFRVFICA